MKFEAFSLAQDTKSCHPIPILPTPYQTGAFWKLHLTFLNSNSLASDHQKGDSSHGTDPKSSQVHPIPVDCLTTIHLKPGMARTGSCNHSPPQQAHTQLQQLSPGHLHLHNEGFSGMLHLRWSVNTLCKHALEKTPEADSSCFAQPAHSPAAHHCEQGSNPK